LYRKCQCSSRWSRRLSNVLRMDSLVDGARTESGCMASRNSRTVGVHLPLPPVVRTERSLPRALRRPGLSKLPHRGQLLEDLLHLGPCRANLLSPIFEITKSLTVRETYPC
jgi:hypothetical protein